MGYKYQKSLTCVTNSQLWKETIDRMKSADQMNTNFQFNTEVIQQQNSPVEKEFDTIAGRGDSMMKVSNLSRTERCKLFKEAFKTATLLDGLVLITKKGEQKTRFEYQNEEKPKLTNHLRTLEEARVVSLRNITK